MTQYSARLFEGFMHSIDPLFESTEECEHCGCTPERCKGTCKCDTANGCARGCRCKYNLFA